MAKLFSLYHGKLAFQAVGYRWSLSFTSQYLKIRTLLSTGLLTSAVKMELK